MARKLILLAAASLFAGSAHGALIAGERLFNGLSWHASADPGDLGIGRLLYPLAIDGRSPMAAGGSRLGVALGSEALDLALVPGRFLALELLSFEALSPLTVRNRAVAAVPEPGIVGLWVVGLLALSLMRWRGTIDSSSRSRLGTRAEEGPEPADAAAEVSARTKRSTIRLIRPRWPRMARRQLRHGA